MRQLDSTLYSTLRLLPVRLNVVNEWRIANTQRLRICADVAVATLMTEIEPAIQRRRLQRRQRSPTIRATGALVIGILLCPHN